MKFVDSVLIEVAAGKGGDGALSFRHEKYVDKGGPDGGDGGKGGDVIFQATKNLNTLLHFRYKQELRAEAGGNGSRRKQHGKNGQNLLVEVPVGTVIIDANTHEELADLTTSGQQAIVAKGGQGGFGNAHFVSSTRQAPRVAELGEQGVQHQLRLELKLLADVGLVGLPNAGKSTFLSAISRATPEIADYPFTTLTPQLGVAEIDGFGMLVADIPGLIEGAAEGKGLGDAFLRHVERTAVLLHLIDVYSNDVAADYTTITQELERYSSSLAQRPRVVALTKCEGFDAELLAMQQAALQAVVPPGTKVFAISSHAKTGIEVLLRTLRRFVEAASTSQSEEPQPEAKELPVIELSQSHQRDAWRVRKEESVFVVTGEKIENFAARTNFANSYAVERLRDIMHKTGIEHELRRAGIAPGDVVRIGSAGHFTWS